MTKILLLYKARTETDNFFDNSKIYGGIEKFARAIYQNIPNVIPVITYPKDRKQKQSRKIIEKALSDHNPDLVITNDIDRVYTNFVSECGYRVILIFHDGLFRDIRYVDMGKRLIDLTKVGNHIYFVSNRQYQFHSDMCKRIHGIPLMEPTGYVNPAYVEDYVKTASEIEYFAGTIGRTDLVKDPFVLHRKLQNTDKKSVVITNIVKSIKENGAQEKYAAKNQQWTDPQTTLRDLSHEKTTEIISHMGCYVSTCPQESWGITALEALSTGIPLLLLTDKSGIHSSETISPSENFYLKLPKNCNQNDFCAAIETLNRMTNRTEIAEKTREMHSKEKWKANMENMIEKRLAMPILSQKPNQITTFFD